ncbi:hypothetical protein QZH41_006433 [Actinostola sp. cb2023]|nr:hypothetical protein QZH41_006433 [Actinostola sp. cb2023]
MSSIPYRDRNSVLFNSSSFDDKSVEKYGIRFNRKSKMAALLVEIRGGLNQLFKRAGIFPARRLATAADAPQEEPFDNSTYKVNEYFEYDKLSYYNLEVEIDAFSLGGAKPATTTGTTQGGFTLGGIASSTPFLSNLVAAPPSNAASTLPTLGEVSLLELHQQERPPWASELEDYERTFLDQAGQVNAWDRLLMENGEKITELNTNVESVKAEQKRYGLSKDIDGQLKQMVGDLKAIIDHLNTAGSTQQGNNDPIKDKSYIFEI